MIDPRVQFRFTPEPSTCELATHQRRCFRASWVVPGDLPYFEGHFPQAPVLPAVAIIDATAELIRQATDACTEILDLCGVKSAKFTSPLTPGMSLEIYIHEISDSEWQAEWRHAASQQAGHSVVQLTVSL